MTGNGHGQPLSCTNNVFMSARAANLPMRPQSPTLLYVWSGLTCLQCLQRRETVVHGLAWSTKWTGVSPRAPRVQPMSKRRALLSAGRGERGHFDHARHSLRLSGRAAEHDPPRRTGNVADHHVLTPLLARRRFLPRHMAGPTSHEVLR